MRASGRAKAILPSKMSFPVLDGLTQCCTSCNELDYLTGHDNNPGVGLLYALFPRI